MIRHPNDITESTHHHHHVSDSPIPHASLLPTSNRVLVNKHLGASVSNTNTHASTIKKDKPKPTTSSNKSFACYDNDGSRINHEFGYLLQQHERDLKGA